MTMQMSKEEQTEYGMKAGHAPVARKVVCVDFDGTLFPWGKLLDPNTKPEPGAAEAVRAFAEAGWTVVVFTSRMSRTWLRFAGEDREVHQTYITDLMKR